MKDGEIFYRARSGRDIILFLLYKNKESVTLVIFWKQNMTNETHKFQTDAVFLW